MNSYIIGYDLDKPGQDYKDLIDTIKKLGNWWHCLDSTWIIKSDLSAVAIRDTIRKVMDSNDKLLVAKLSGEAAWVGFDTECSNWLKTNL